MNISVFDSVSDNYGSSRICRLIIDIMQSAGHDVDAYVGIERLPKAQRYAKTIGIPMLVMARLRQNIILYIYEFFTTLQAFRTSLPLLLNNTDIAYCNTLATLPVAWCCKRYGIKTVLHLHETTESFIIRLIGRFLLPRVAHRVICVSHAVAKSWKIESHPNTLVIHNGIPDLHNSKHLKLGDSRLYDVCYVGRLTEKKGISCFLAALHVLSRGHHPPHNQPLKVAIAGGTVPGQPLPPELGRIGSHTNLHVTYLGEVDDTSEVFLHSKVACVPSLFHDPFPTVVLEAMRAGCTIVASELGGAKEALEQASAELVPPGNVKAISDAILRQLATWGEQSVAQNRLVFLRHFTLETFRSRMLAIDIFKQDTI